MVLGLGGMRAQPPAGIPASTVNWPAFLGRQDLIWSEYPGKWENAPFIGNGNLGAYIRLEQGGALAWDVNRTDVTHDGLRYPIGHLAIQVAGGFETTGEIRLDLWNAEVRGTMKTARGPVQWRTFAVGSPAVIVLELTGIKAEPGPEVVWLSTLARPPRLGKRTDAYPPEALHPPPDVRTVIDGVNCTQSFLGGGAFAVVLRRIDSAVDRKVYVLSVDRGDTAKRALSEAQLSAERAASLGMNGLLAAHRSWWHQYYPASFVSLPDARLEAFYWIQMYKLGSALRAGGPVLDVMGPWYRSNPPVTGPVTALNRQTGMAYSPIFTANRLALGDSLFTTDLRQPNQDLTQISELVWEDYRYGMDENVLNSRVIPLLVRAIQGPKVDPTFSRWALQTLIRIGDRPKSPDPRVAEWKQILAALPPATTPPRSLLHFRPDRPGERKLIEAAVRQDEGRTAPGGAKAGGAAKASGETPRPPNRGRGLGEAASLRAMLGQGGQALEDLNVFLNRYLRANTFYSDPSPLIGAPLSAAGAVQDMLLQSWGNKLRVFPAMPAAWKEACFSTLRGEGGFLVSAVWHEDAVAWVRVEATAAAPCRVVVPHWTQAVIRAARRPDIAVTPADVPGEFLLTLGKGGWAILSPAADSPLPPMGQVTEAPGFSDNPYPPHPSQ